MPINFTVVPVEDAEGGGSAAAASGAKADRTVPTVVVEDGEAQPAQDSGTSDRWSCCCSASVRDRGFKVSATVVADTDYNDFFPWLEPVERACVCLRVCSHARIFNSIISPHIAKILTVRSKFFIL